MSASPSPFAAAVQRQKAKDLVGAEALFRQAVRDDPDVVEGWLRLGEVCERLGHASEAAEACRQVLRLRPDHSGARNNLGVLLLNQGQLVDAKACFEEVLLTRPDFADAHSNRGITLMSLGEITAAENCFRNATRLRPDYPEAWNNLAMALARQGKHDQAVDAFRTALRLKADFAQAHANLGSSLRELGRPVEALESMAEALRCCPADAELHNDRGVLLLLQRQFTAASAHFREAVRLRPDYVEAHNNLGKVLVEEGQPAAALICFDRALELRPEFATAHFNRSVALELLGKIDEALAGLHHTLRLRPDYPEALNNLGNALKEQGRIDEAAACYRRGLALRPGDPAITSNLLFLLQYHPNLNPEALWEEHRRFGAAAETVEKMTLPPPSPLVGRRLRIGYVSPDFRSHVMGSFALLVIPAHDRERFEVVCYADLRKADATTQLIQKAAERWVDLTGLSHAEAASRIGADAVDILIDLGGHTGGNRLPVFARAPAPIQGTLFAYPGTTGLTRVTYRITDQFLDPPGITEGFHSERMVRLSGPLWCYRGGPELNPGPPPVLRKEHITFGCLNNPAKMTAERIARWAEVMRAVPRSRMVLLGGGSVSSQDRFLNTFAVNGIEARRVTVLGRRAREDYFRPYLDMDICLDTYPYTGCNTTADSLWMGVPVVTQTDRWSVTRQGVAPLTLTGLSELIVDTPEEFVTTAVRLAGDIGKLTLLRRELRDRLRQSPLMDVVTYTRNLESLYQELWAEHLGNWLK